MDINNSFFLLSSPLLFSRQNGLMLRVTVKIHWGQIPQFFCQTHRELDSKLCSIVLGISEWPEQCFSLSVLQILVSLQCQISDWQCFAVLRGY